MIEKRLTKLSEALLLVGALTAASCGGSPDHPPGGTTNHRDGGGAGDGAVADGSLGDGSSGGDSAVNPGHSDGGDASGPAPVPSCDVESEQLSVPIDNRGSHQWDALQVENTIHLAYEVTVCEAQVVAQAQRIDYLKFASTGAFGTAEKLVNFADDACYFTRTPTLAPSSEPAPLLYYTSTRDGAAELYEKQIGSSAVDTRLTIDPDSLSDSEEHTVAVPFGVSNLIAYANALAQNSGPSIGKVVTRRVGFDEQIIVSADQGFHINDLALVSFRAASKYGGAIAWVADVGKGAGINIQLLDKAGKPSGMPTKLSSQVSGFSNVALVMPEGSNKGAIVYGVSPTDDRSELRFRILSDDGTIGDEVQLTENNRNVQGVGIAPFAAGYIVAFRSIATGNTGIHVQLVDPQGEVGAERAVVSSSASGSPPKVFVTTDGRVSIVFSDIDGTGSTLRAVRATCNP